MNKGGVGLLATVALALALGLRALIASPDPSEGTAKPNVLLVLVDDAHTSMVDYILAVRELLVEQGTGCSFAAEEEGRVRIDGDWEKRRVGNFEGLEGIDRRTFVKMSGLSAAAKKGGWGMSRSVLPLASMMLALLLSCLAIVAQSAEGQATRHAGHLGGNLPPGTPRFLAASPSTRWPT